MRYTVVEHPSVERDLIAISDLIADYAGVTVANAKIDEITAFITDLADFPHIGSLRHELLPDLRALPAGDKAVICFTVDDEARVLRILNVSYAGSNWQKAVIARR